MISGRLEPGAGDDGPVLVLGDRRVSWEEMGRDLISGGAVEVVLAASLSTEDASPVDMIPTGVEASSLLAAPAAREPADATEGERWAEAVALLTECLPPGARYPCPVEELAAACAGLRHAA